jgi:hypothetical protein
MFFRTHGDANMPVSCVLFELDLLNIVFRSSRQPYRKRLTSVNDGFVSSHQTPCVSDVGGHEPCAVIRNDKYCFQG